MYLEEIKKEAQSIARRLKKSALPKAAEVFEKCFPVTAETTVKTASKDDTFLITGDIPAMWLRDSTAQVVCYLPLAKQNADVADFIEGLCKRQFKCICHDPYANAYNERENGGHCNDDDNCDDPLIWERKYEVDSLCYAIKLCYDFYKVTGRRSHFDGTFFEGAKKILTLFEKEQRHKELSDYKFIRPNTAEHDTMPKNGEGNPVGFTGMTWSGFRPSDDRCFYNYLIPSNMFAAVELLHLAEIFEKTAKNGELSQKCRTLSAEIRQGIKNYGCVVHEKFGKMYAYETDGLGNYILSDDANVPSLLSAPYLGFCSKNDPVYEATRDFVLSKDNPFYFEGRYAKGVGSPHTPKSYVWHIALSMQGLTAKGKEEKLSLLKMLVSTTDGTDLMHEGFDANDPSKYTRPWFAWSCSLFCEFVMHCLDQGVI